MSADRVCERRWMPYAQAARDYLGISPDVLRGAINRGELPAYEKPVARGRAAAAGKQRHSYFVNLADVDNYIREFWTEASE